MRRIHVLGPFYSLAGRLLRLVMVAMFSGAFALYAVGTHWYWLAVGKIPGHVFASIAVVLGHARSLLADDAAVAEDQADFYAAWLFICCFALLGLTTAEAVRRIWPARKS